MHQHESSTGGCPCLPIDCVVALLPASVRLQQKRAASFRTRTVSTIAMIAGFLAIIYMGHVPLVLLVLTLQVSNDLGLDVGQMALQAVTNCVTNLNLPWPELWSNQPSDVQQREGSSQSHSCLQ